jgi:hypothetical protein
MPHFKLSANSKIMNTGVTASTSKQIAKIMNEVMEENPLVSVQAASSKANHDEEEANNDTRE